MGIAILTIGHGNRTLDELLEALRAHAITQLVDVRSFPGSRRNPQFGRQELERSLPANRISDALTIRGIGVLHILDSHKSERHRPTDFLRVENGRLLYPERPVAEK
jgi:uncharacterized protein (DUF488 family)